MNKNMEIKIKPQVFIGYESWEPKRQGVVFVAKEEDIEPVWEALCEQDDYWESYKHVIKVAPTEIDSISDICWLCEYCGKTDIYNVPKLKAKLAERGIEIILYQYNENRY